MSSGSSPKPTKKIVKSFTVPPDLCALAMAAAAKEDRNFSYIVCRALARDMAEAKVKAREAR